MDPAAQMSQDTPAAIPELHFVVTNPEGVLQAALVSLVMRVQGGRAASLADANGLPIASTLSGPSLRLTSALAAMIARTARIVLDAMGRDRLQAVVIEGSATAVVACEVGKGTGTLVLVLEGSRDLEAAKRETMQTATEITTLLDSDAW